MSDKENLKIKVQKWNDPLIKEITISTSTDRDKFVNIELSKEANCWGIILFYYEIKYLLEFINSDYIDRDKIDDGDVLECISINEGNAISFTLSHRANGQVIILTKNELHILLTYTI